MNTRKPFFGTFWQSWPRTLLTVAFALVVLSAQSQSHKIDSLKNELTVSSASQKIPILLGLSLQFLNVNIDTASTYADRALQLALDRADKHQLAIVYSQIARIKLVSASYDDALDNLLKAESLFKAQPTIDKKELLRVYSNLGTVYERQDELTKSQQYFEQAIELLAQSDKESGATTPSPLFAPLYNNFANTIIKQGDTAKAIVYQKKGLGYAMDAHDFHQASSILNNIGKLHLERKQIAEAYPYLKRGAAMRKSIQDDRGLSASYRNLALYFLAANNFDSAKVYIRRSIQLYEKIGNMIEPLNGDYQVLSDIYQSENKFDSALYAFKIHIQYKDSIYSGPKFKELARVEAKYEMLKKTQEEQALQKARELKVIFTIAALVVGLIILSFFFVVQRFRSKNQRLQYEQLKLREEKLITEQNGLQLELEYKRKDLATQMLFLLKKDEFIHKLSQRISSVKEEVPPEVQPKLQKITRELFSISRRNDTSWQEFELRFKEVHQDFYQKLEGSYPDLTPKERRLCALLKLNMTTKEIASITHQSTRSLEVARTRLRKKFSLTNSDVGLVDFLSKI